MDEKLKVTPDIQQNIQPQTGIPEAQNEAEGIPSASEGGEQQPPLSSPIQQPSEVSGQDVAPEGFPQDLWDKLGDNPQPPQATPIEATIEGDKSTIGYITEAIKGFNSGPVAALNEAMDLSYSTSKFAVDIFKEGWSKAKFVEQDAPFKFPEYHPEGIVGGITKGFTQWGTGFLLAGAAGTAGAFGKGVTSVGGKAALALGRDAAANVVFFDRQEQRFSNFMEQFPELRNPLTGMLQAKPDDSVPVSMAKMAVEGAGLGAAAEVIIAGLKCLRSGAKTLWGKANTRYSVEQYAKDVDELNKVLADRQAIEGKPTAEAPELPEGVAGKPTEETGAKPQAAADELASLPEGSTGKPTEEPGAQPEGGHEAAPDGLPAKPEEPAAGGTSASGEESAKSTLGPENLAPAKDVLKIVSEAAKEENPLSGVHPGINLNHEVFDKAGGSHILYKLSDLQAENTIKAAGPEKYSELVSSAVDEVKQMGFTYDINLNEGKEALASINQAEKNVLTARAVMHNLCDASMTLASKINNGTASALDAARFVMLSKNMQEFVTLNADLRTVTDRMLGSRGTGVSDELAHSMSGAKDSDAFFSKWLSAENMTEAGAVDYLVKSGISREMIMDVARRTIVSDNPINNVRVLKQLKPEFSVIDSLVEMRVNNISSDPVKHIANIAVTGMNSFLVKPVERMIGGALTFDKQSLVSGWNMLRGMTGSVGTAWEFAGKALRVGDNILDQAGNRFEHQTHQLSYERIRNSLLKGKPEGADLSPMQELMARSMGWLGTVTRISSRLGVAEDEFFKQMTFRGQLYADIANEAAEKGIKGKDVEAYASARLKDVFDANGLIIQGDLSKKAWDFARDATWASPLEGNSIGGWLQQGVNNHASLKLLFPFIKKPINIFYDVMRHNPAALMSSRVRAAIMEGGEARADALGRIATGSLLITSGVQMAAEGRVTGAYPENPKLKALWQENGIKPYSIKAGDSWLEYRQFDPFGLILSVSVDAYNHVSEESYDRAGNSDVSKPVMKAMTGVLMAVAENLSDNKYVRDVSDAMNAITKPQRYMDHYLKTTAASFVPYSGALRWHKNNFGDPQQRETESWLDYMRNTTSAFSKDLPPKMSWLTGKPVLYSGHIKEPQKHDGVLEELLRLGSSVTGAPAREIEGVPLAAEQYSRLCELHGGMKVEGKSMYDVLHTVMNSEGYDIKRERLGDGIPGQPTPRSDLVNKIIRNFRDLSEYQLKKEYPDIMEKVKQAKINRKASKAGAMTKDNQQTLLENLIH
ncbi:hypothetical protein [uncultured Desulfovibrio sp.]|uniref:hypothetical protein n=1 Tax=uncultured Desulfovibrio sp. TaxID=167968 RepID=UPI00260BCAB2|nr:hypothetical protein [uncultured Desulfovibrio sp.]